MRFVLAIVISGMVGYFAALGIYHVTNDYLIEVIVGLPLIFINGVLVGKGVTSYR